MPPAFLVDFWCLFLQKSVVILPSVRKSENFDRIGLFCCMNQHKPNGLMDVIRTEEILSEDTDLRYR